MKNGERFRMELPEGLELPDDVSMPEISTVKAVIRKVMAGEEGSYEEEKMIEFPQGDREEEQ